MQRMKVGDQILIHLTENKTAGICKVTREYFEDNSKIWPDGEIYQHRIGIEPSKILPNPIDGKYSYDKYLREKHGNPRGYFGNAIREISDDEFSIFESDIDKSINEQDTKNRLQVNSDKVGSEVNNNDDTKESKMGLEEAIRLIKQQLENEPQRLADEQSVITKYGSMFNPHNIRNLTSEDFLSFLSYENNKHWNHIHRTGKIITKDMEKLRSVLRDFLDDAKPINERLDTIISDEKSHIDGLGRAILTPILLVVYPEKYAVYNSVTEYAMKYFGIFPGFTASETLGERYSRLIIK